MALVALLEEGSVRRWAEASVEGSAWALAGSMATEKAGSKEAGSVAMKVAAPAEPRVADLAVRSAKGTVGPRATRLGRVSAARLGAESGSELAMPSAMALVRSSGASSAQMTAVASGPE